MKTSAESPGNEIRKTPSVRAPGADVRYPSEWSEIWKLREAQQFAGRCSGHLNVRASPLLG